MPDFALRVVNTKNDQQVKLDVLLCPVIKHV